jgi:hypothetical protein
MHAIRRRRWLVLAALAGLLYPTAPRAQSVPPGGSWQLRLPERPWALVVDLPGFVLDEQWPERNGTRRMLRAHHPETDVIVSAFLEANPELASKEQCAIFTGRKASGPPSGAPA